MLGKEHGMASTHHKDRLGRRARRWGTAAAALALLALAPSMPASAEDRDDRIDPENVGYVLERGRARTVAVPGAVRTVVAGLNDQSDIVGKFTDADCRDHGFVRNRRGRYVPIDVPGAMATQANKVNDRGQVVGAYNRQDTYALTPGGQGFLWDQGRFTTIDVPGAVFTQASGINDGGVVVGEYLDSDGNFHGFRWHRGRLETIEVPGSASTSVADINDRGDLAGVTSGTDGGPRGFVLLNRASGRVERLDTGTRYSLATGINNRRHVVGTAANDLDNSAAQGFLLTGRAGGTVTPLEIRGTTRTAPFDINNRGQIVANIFPTGTPPCVDEQTDAAQPMDTPGMPLAPDSSGGAEQPTSP
jgi:uncharacterized membrane protein